MTTYSNHWEVKGDLKYCGNEVVTFILETGKKQTPEYFDFFPFLKGWTTEVYVENNFFCIQIKDILSSLPIMGGVISDEKLIADSKNIFSSNQYPNFETCYNIFKDNGYHFGLFTYVGKVEGNKLCWQHINEVIIDWLNKVVILRILELNTKRVTDAIPTPPSYDISKLLENIYVIESEKGMKQGTAFHLKEFGIVTCDHCIRNETTNEIFTDLVIFKGNEHSKKIAIKIIKTNKDMDLTIIETPKEILTEGLVLGSSDNLNQLDHIGVAGFPHYNFGDNGIFLPGLIIGFRTYAGLRHILVNSPLISGNSGGPAFDKDSKVIGIAVTGADRMSKAHETEKHGLIPIEALNYLK